MLNRLEMMRIFSVTAESSSFKEAASRLGISPQTVTRAIQMLEETVGEPLFYRNTRQIHITNFGEHLAQRAKISVADIDRLFQPSIQQPEADMAGIVRITAPTTIGRRFLPPILSQISKDYPKISFEICLSDAITDVIQQQIDIGIRVGFLRDSNFVARATAKIYFNVVASPDLIARMGSPSSIEALLKFPSIALLNDNNGKTWPWYFRQHEQYKHIQPAFITNDAETELKMALAGNGFAQIADCLSHPYVTRGELVKVLEEYAPHPWDLYVYRPQRGPVPVRIRMVYDKIAEAFSNMESLDYA